MQTERRHCQVINLELQLEWHNGIPVLIISRQWDKNHFISLNANNKYKVEYKVMHTYDNKQKMYVNVCMNGHAEFAFNALS